MKVPFDYLLILIYYITPFLHIIRVYFKIAKTLKLQLKIFENLIAPVISVTYGGLTLQLAVKVLKMDLTFDNLNHELA